MKRSKIYYLAQKAVLGYQFLNVEEKLEALAELMDRERLEKLLEKQEAQEAESNG